MDSEKKNIIGFRKDKSASSKPPKSTARVLIEWAVTLAIALLGVLFIQAYLVKPYRIPSGSMEPTLSIGQRVLVDRLGMHFGDPHVGDIVVFNPPVGAEQGVCGDPQQGENTTTACSVANTQKDTSVTFIKRIVAGPGDTITIKDGHVIRNGKQEPDSFTYQCPGNQTEEQCTFSTPITIPAGHWFMMGDNRGDSEDSRFWGPVPTSWIIGVQFASYWPPSKIF